MIVKTLKLDMYIPNSNSLKDKRSVLKSILVKCRQKFNVSAAELGALDNHRKAIIGIVTISNSSAYADKVLDKCLNFIEMEYDVEIISIELERN